MDNVYSYLLDKSKRDSSILSDVGAEGLRRRRVLYNDTWKTFEKRLGDFLKKRMGKSKIVEISSSLCVMRGNFLLCNGAMGFVWNMADTYALHYINLTFAVDVAFCVHSSIDS